MIEHPRNLKELRNQAVAACRKEAGSDWDSMFEGDQQALIESWMAGYYAGYDRLKKYEDFFNSVSCLFAEGVEFMTKDQIYSAIKADWNKFRED